jgi:hypothetical protein
MDALRMLLFNLHSGTAPIADDTFNTVNTPVMFSIIYVYYELLKVPLSSPSYTGDVG